MKHILEITQTGAPFHIKKFYISDYIWTDPDRLPDNIKTNNNRNAYTVVTEKNRSDVEEFLGTSIQTDFVSYVYMLSDEELAQAILFLS